MAEALGLASSIVALVQLSASVYSATSKFYREAKEAKSKIGALATQTRNLSGVLQSLSLLASSPLFDDAAVSVPDFRDTYIESCHATLHKIKRKLEKAEVDFETGSHRKLIMRSLKWPFALQETKDLIAELGHHQDVLQLALSADTMSHLLQCLANTNSIAKSIDTLNRRLERKDSIDTRAELTAKREKIVQFFLKVNPEGHFQDCRSQRQPNTGKWLVERNQTFLNWMSSVESQIWLSGIPGAGKTILCGAVIDEMLQAQTPSAAVAFFFCDYKYPESLNPVNILAALAVQLAKQADAAFEVLESYHEELHPDNGIGKPTETKRMIEILHEIIGIYDRVYFAIDGLDECGTNVVEILQSLNQLTQGNHANMALFSRDEPDIAEELSDNTRVEISAHTEDLELYVLAQMETRKRLGSLAVKNPDLHEHIRRTLVEGANGMFRWVACQLDHLDGLSSDGRRRKALTELPPTLFGTYDRVLDRILQEDEHDQELCRKALHWIGLGYTAFNPLALCEAISIPDDLDIADEELMVEPDWVSRRCSSLIRLFRKESGILRFELAHFTVKEYLRGIKPQSERSAFRFSEDKAVRELLGCSLRFLTFPVFDRRPTIALSEIRRMVERNEQHPFYPWAAVYVFCLESLYQDDNLGEQLSLLLEEDAMMKYAKQLFSPDKTGLFLSWVLQVMSKWGGKFTFDEECFPDIIGFILAPGFTSLHVSTALSLPSICTHLLSNEKVDPNVCCRRGTPLHALLTGPRFLSPVTFEYDSKYHYRKRYESKEAPYDRSSRCLEILLENKADTSIQWDNTSIFQMAINNSIQAPQKKLWIEPLITSSTVVSNNCIQDFREKLAAGAIDRSILDAIFALGSGSEIASGWARLASLIQMWRMQEGEYGGRDLPLDVEERISDEDFADGIRIALSQHLTDTLRVYVQDPRFRPGMRVNYDGNDAMPILQFAIWKQCLKSVELLLQAGCDPQVVDDNDGWTTLHQCAATDTGDAGMTAVLLRWGAVESVKNQEGQTCWHLAAIRGNTPVLKVLIDMGCDTKQSLATISSSGRTPLAHAILEEEVESALLLLNHCTADLEVFQSDQSLLDMAAAIGDEDLFVRLHEKLKEAGATEAISSAKPLDNIDTGCSGELLDYLLAFWAVGRHWTSTKFTNYLLDANNAFFEDPENYPARCDMDHVVRELLPPKHVFVDDEKTQSHAWEIFCERVVPRLTSECDHTRSRCRLDLINMIFEILINIGVLASYERDMHLPGYRVYFQALSNRNYRLNCSWVATSVCKVMQPHKLSGGLSGEAVCVQLLSHAVGASNFDLVEELLDCGVDVHGAHSSVSPLEQACFTHDSLIFNLVLGHSKRSLISRAGSSGKTLLHWVVSGEVPGSLVKIQQLIQLDIRIIDKVLDNELGDTALTMASRTLRQVDVVQLLVSRGANPLHRARDGWTLLHAAAASGDPLYIQSLDPSETPMPFWLGVCNFCFRGLGAKPLVVEKTTATHIAARNGRSYFLKHLIRKNRLFNVNAITGYPFLTPLHLAAWFGQLEVVEILLTRDAKVNARDASGMLPIDYAAKRSHLGIFMELLKSGSDKPSGSLGSLVANLMSETTDFVEGVGDSNAVSQFNFENAIMHGDLNLCMKLVEKGHSINSELFSRSYTPLVRAVVEEQTRIVDWLVSIGVKVTNPIIEPLHPSLRSIASLSTHYLSSTKSLSDVLGLALKQGVSWYGSILGPLHVAILDDNMEALRTILSHIRGNENTYRKMIETEMVHLPTDIVDWRDRSAMSILVNDFNREEALLDESPWEESMPSGSPLHWAIRQDNLSAVSLLVQYESDVNQVDSLGHGSLKLAVSNACSKEIIKTLLSAGANSTDRLYAIIEAAEEGDLEVIRILAEADPEILRAADRFSMVGLLNNSGSVEVFQYLLSQGLRQLDFKIADLSIVSFKTTADEFSAFTFNSGLLSQATEGQLSLAFSSAVVEGDFAILKRFYHAVPNDFFIILLNSTFYGRPSALCAAASRNAGTVVEHLIAMGAEIDLEGSPYGSPLMTACALGCFDVVRRLVRSGAALCYVNEDGLLRNAVTLSLGHQELLRWFLVERHVEQRKLDNQPGQVTSQQVAWSGPRAFKLALPTYVKRDFGESRWSHLRRLQKWKEGLLGATLAESRRNSGLDFKAELEAESKTNEAQAAHRRFLAHLGEY